MTAVSLSATNNAASATVYAIAKSSGDLHLTVVISGIEEAQAKDKLSAIPEIATCDWSERVFTTTTIAGICHDYLRTRNSGAAVAVKLQPIVRFLHDQGVGTVEAHVTLETRMHGSVPAGWKLHQAQTYTATSHNVRDLPTDFPVIVNDPFDGARILLPVWIVLLGPGILAWVLASKGRGGDDDQKVNWLVWLTWIDMAVWLYWISAVRTEDIVDFAAKAGFGNAIVTFAIALFVYIAPPLLSAVTCFTAMGPLLSSSDESFFLLLQRQVVAQATFLVPFGIFFISGSMSTFGFGAISALGIVAAYGAYRWFVWLNRNLTFTEVTPVESGDLYNRAQAIAAKAGLKLSNIGVIQTRIPEEANAMATSGDKIFLTSSLLKGLTPREVDAVIAHEVGHHSAGHTKFNLSTLVFWVYILFGGPAVSWLLHKIGAPDWALAIPIAPVLYTLIQGQLSQRHEYAADERAVQLTNDPEAKIAALGRLVKLSRIPAQSAGALGSILSHPSMQDRVLHLARRFGVPDARAIEILKNPDRAYAGQNENAIAAPAPDVAPQPAPERVFSERSIMQTVEIDNWIRLALLVFTPMLLSLIIGAAGLRPPMLVRLYLYIGPFVLVALCRWAHGFIGARYLANLKGRVSQRINPAPGALFASIHPDQGVRYSSGSSDWDFGFVSLEGDWFCFRGERARFALPRQAIRDIRVVSGRWDWARERRVQLVYSGGDFTFSHCYGVSPKNEMLRIQRWLEEWKGAAMSSFPIGPPPEVAPVLPSLPCDTYGRLFGAFVAGKECFKVGIISLMIAAAVSSFAKPFVGTNANEVRVLSWAMLSLAPVISAIGALLYKIPGAIFPVRPPQPTVVEEKNPSEQIMAAAASEVS